MQAQRLVFPAKHQCEIESLDVAKPAAGQILVESQCSLISPGTEMSFYDGHHSRLQNVDPTQPKAWASYPFYPGYSLGCIVLETGEGCKFKAGQRVVVHHNHMSACCVEEGRATAVPDGLAMEEAVFLELAAISLNGVRRAHIQMGDSVVVMGAGLIGLLAITMAKLDGAEKIIVMDPDASRRELAMQHGATHGFDPLNSSCDQAIKDLTGGWGADVVIEASGNCNAIVLGLSLTRQCGRMVLLGCQHGEIMFSFYEGIQSRSITVIGAHVNSSPNVAQTSIFHTTKQRDFELIMQWMKQRQLDVSQWITHYITPAEANQMYEAISQRACKTLGIIIRWK
jgi:2-desacetyl-2-hydroxyethyl bacteriochlorophyllide A dehydrogenase